MAERAASAEVLVLLLQDMRCAAVSTVKNNTFPFFFFFFTGALCMRKLEELSPANSVSSLPLLANPAILLSPV